MGAITALSFRTLLAAEAERIGSDRDVEGADIVAPAGAYDRRRATIIGDGNITAGRENFLFQMNMTRQSYPAVHRLELSDATVAGQGSVITRHGKLLTESAVEFLNHGRVPDGFQRANTDEFALVSAPARHVTAPCLLVKRPWWRNYGHWLVDGAALLAITAALQMPEDLQIVVGRQENPLMRQVVHDTIRMLAPGVPVLEHPDDEAWVFSKLHYITPVHVPPLFKLPLAMTSLRASVLAGLPQATRRRRIYIARDSRNGRAIANEAEIRDICEERGFDFVQPERFPISAQAIMFHESEIVVGMKGAGMTNALFCTDESAVFALSPGTFTDPFFWDLVAQNNIDYTEMFGKVIDPLGPASPNVRFAIDPAIFSSTLDAIIERVTGRVGRRPGL